MTLIELIHTILLLILVDRQFLIRNRYKFAFEYHPKFYSTISNKTESSYFHLWLYRKDPQGDKYSRHKSLFIMTLSKEIKGNEKSN